MPAADLHAELLLDLRPHDRNDPGFVRYGVGSDGAVAVVYAVTHESLYDESPQGARFPKGQLDNATVYDVVVHRDGSVTNFRVADEHVVASHVLPTSQGLLLVACRCRLPPGGLPEKNAVHFDSAGRVIKRFTLGDGIADIAMTPNGWIWASYSDEGIYGNYGWGGDRTPIGQPGIVAFDLGGRVQWANDKFVFDDHSNVAPCPNNDVWVHGFDGEYEVLRVSLNGEKRLWRRDRGASLAAVDSDRVMRSTDGLGIAQQSKKALQFDAVQKLCDRKGKPLTYVEARTLGSRLFLFSEQAVHVLADW